MNKRARWLFYLLFCASPLRADTVPPPKQYNQIAREVISQCSRVEIEYEFVSYPMGPDFISVGSVGLTPRDATFLADTISVGQAVTKAPDISGTNRFLNFTFYNGKKMVAMAGSDLSEQGGAIVLLPWKQQHADYFLTSNSAKTLRNWVLKQPQLAKKFPH